MVWSSHLKDSATRKTFEESVLHGLNTPFGTRLRQIVETYKQGVEYNETTEDYSSPSWSHKQAHRNGMRQAYEEVLRLLRGITKE